MSKGVITKTWLGGMVALAIGFVIAASATGLMLAYGGTFKSAPSGNGYDFVPTLDGFFWSMVGLICVGGFLAIGGAIVQFVAWIGALVNSYQLRDKLWFALTLILGLIGFGLIVMIAYIVAAPDGYEEKERLGTTSSRPAAVPQLT